MSEHTPGPWESAVDGAEIWPTDKNSGKYCVELARVVGPWDGSSFYDAEEARANASLIETAPDLIAAAVAFNAAMDNWYDGPEHPATPELLKAWEQARKAIAKARA